MRLFEATGHGTAARSHPQHPDKKKDTYSIAGTGNYIVKDGELLAAAFESSDGKVRAHMRAAEIVAKLNDAERYLTEYEWVGEGPSVEEAGGRELLARDEFGSLRNLQWAYDGWFDEHGHRITSKATCWTPVGWRRMPPHDATRKV